MPQTSLTLVQAPRAVIMSSSDTEKAAADLRDVEGDGAGRVGILGDLPPDPDAHLSEEQREAVVSANPPLLGFRTQCLALAIV